MAGGDASEAIAEEVRTDGHDSLRKELIMTLFDRMNPGALLAEAQRIADLDVDLNVNVQPTIDGGVRIDFVDLPEGLTAGLEVYRSAKYANVVGMELQCNQSEPEFLAGAIRLPPKLSVKVWADGVGKVSNLVISTECPPAYRQSLNAGIDINRGDTIYGLSYHLNIKEPTKSGMTVLLKKDGVLTTQAVPANLYGEPWPQMDKVQHFASTLLALQQSLK